MLSSSKSYFFRMLIPKILWQTYKSSDPPVAAAACMASWRKCNHNHEFIYMGDLECEAFMEQWFEREFFEMYCALPVGVMKADVWRVAVVYVHGGIYADIDTECRAPVEDWIGSSSTLVAAVENDTGALGNFVFAATPRHPALYRVLQTFVELYHSESFMNASSPTPVQDFGAGAWSMGILKYYDLFDQQLQSKGGLDYGLSRKVIADNVVLYSAQSHVISAYPNENTLVFHQTASVFWGNSYHSWRGDQRLFFGGYVESTHLA